MQVDLAPQSKLCPPPEVPKLSGANNTALHNGEPALIIRGWLHLGGWHPQLGLPEGRLCLSPVTERARVLGSTGWIPGTPEMVLGLIAQGLLAPGATAAPGPGRLPRSAQGGNADSSPGWLSLHAYLAHLLARPREDRLRDDHN